MQVSHSSLEVWWFHHNSESAEEYFSVKWPFHPDWVSYEIRVYVRCMYRRYGVILAIIVLLAGCTGGPIQEPTDSVQTSTSDRTPGCPSEFKQPGHYDPKDIPNAPEEITSDSVTEYATAHAEATTWNHEIANSSYHIDPGPTGFSVRDMNETADGYLVTVRGFGYRSCDLDSDGNYSIATTGATVYTYLINETLVMRRGGFWNASNVRDRGTVITRLNGSSNEAGV